MLKRILNKIIYLHDIKAHFKPFKAYLNWLRANIEMAFHVEQIYARPLRLIIDATNVCILKCPFCPTGMKEHDRKPGYADINMLTRLFAELGDYLFFIDFFNWGEPFLNKEVLFHWLQQASLKKIITSVSTNLNVKLSDSDIDCIITSGLNNLSISLDGASEQTYSIYRRNGNFQLVLDNIRRIVEAKRQKNSTSPWITWQFLVFGFNEHEMSKASVMAREIGVNEIKFMPPFVKLDLKDGIQWLPKNSLFQKEAYTSKKTEPPQRCDWHYLSAAINWDGTVAPCCAVYKTKDDFGTIGPNGEHSYMKVINNEKYRAIRRFYAKGKKEKSGLICEECPLSEIMTLGVNCNRSIFSTTVLQIFRLVLKPFIKSRTTKE